VINVDGHAAYLLAISQLKAEQQLGRRCSYRPVAYLNNILEQDHRFIKKRIAVSLWFRTEQGAMCTGYEAMNMIRKGQVRLLSKGDVVGQAAFIEDALGIAA
jgi:transposase-like protein